MSPEFTAPYALEWSSELARTVVRVLGGLVDTHGDNPIRAPYHFAVVSRILAGTADTELVENADTIAAALKLGKIQWARLVGRIGGVALRAVSPVVSDEERTALLRFLEVWSYTPMAERTARLRRGATRTSTTAVRTGTGAVVVLGLAYSGGAPRPFVDRAFGPDDPPILGEVDHVAEAPLVWGDADQLTRLIASVRENGPIRWDRKAVDFLAEAIGVPRGSAALLLAGALIRSTGGGEFPTVHQRKRLGLTVGEVESAAAKEFRGLDCDTRLDLLATALPEDPEILWEPAGLQRVAERIVPVWHQRFGRRPAVPVTTLTAVDSLHWNTPAGELSSWLAEPHNEPLLTDDLTTWVNDYGNGCNPRAEWVRFTAIVESVTAGLRWAYAELPAGDPVRDGVPRARDLLLRRLDNPGLLLRSPARHLDSDTVTGRFGASPYFRLGERDADFVDDGLTIIRIDRSGKSELFFRPAELDKDERTDRLDRTVTDHLDTDLARVRRLRSDAAQALAQRIRADALPQGDYETNPAASAPDLVREATDELGLSTDAATLYLQLLTLGEPTDRNVCTWNHWSRTRHKKAGTELLNRKLVVHGSRTRANRTLFLPGEWIEYDWLGSGSPREKFKDTLTAAAQKAARPVSFDWWLLPARFAFAWNNRPTS